MTIPKGRVTRSSDSNDVARRVMDTMDDKFISGILSGTKPDKNKITIASSEDGELVIKGSHRTPSLEEVTYHFLSLIKTKQAKERDSETKIQFRDVFTEAYGVDALFAFVHALSEEFGWATAIPTPTLFGENPPSFQNVQIGPNERASIVMGRFEIPGKNYVISSEVQNGKFVLGGHLPKGDLHVMASLAKRVRDFLKTKSIYKGKAIQFRDDEWPIFLDFSEPVDLILNDDTSSEIEASIFTPIIHSEAVKKMEIPMKRGVLLSGKYGVGKTLTARLTAQVAAKHGWTFVLLKDADALSEAIEFARIYQPSVLFVEDIDQSVFGTDRTGDINSLLNEIDGVVSKDTEVMVVMTTNHIEKINRAMLRPGRVDAIINIDPPNEETVKQLLILYGQGRIDTTSDLSEVARILNGQIPAIIRETVERAKLYALTRGTDKIIIDDLRLSAKNMIRHAEIVFKEAVVDGGDDTVREAVQKIFNALDLTDNPHFDSIAGRVWSLSRFEQKWNEMKEKIDIIYDKMKG